MSNSTSSVSVIVPTKDRRALLADAIASVRAQSYQNWELIVVDDASTDGSADLVNEISRQDPRVRLVKLPASSTGAPAARNLGVRESAGALIIFLDSDDLLAPHCLQQRVQAMHEGPQLDFAVFPCQIFRDRPGDLKLLFNADTGEDDLDRLLKVDVPWQTTSPIWRRAALEKLGEWDEDAINGQDWEFHIRAIVANLKYQRFSSAPDCFWRRPSGQRDSIGKSSELEAKYLRGRMDVIRKMYRLVRDRGLLNDARREVCRVLYFKAANRLADKVSRRDARTAWSAAREDGVVDARQHRQGWIYLMAHRWRPLRELARARLARKWSPAYFAGAPEFFLRAPMQPEASSRIPGSPPVTTSPA